MSIRTLLLAALCLPALALADAPPASTAPAATTTAAPAVSTTAQLGKVDVTGPRPLVEVLQQMKTAIDAPYNNDPKHYDDMVCRIVDNDGFRAQGAVLDCGTQGYYALRRARLPRDMDPGEDVSL